jgi:hypothetical protein
MGLALVHRQARIQIAPIMESCPQNLWITLWMSWGKGIQVGISTMGFAVWSTNERKARIA